MANKTKEPFNNVNATMTKPNSAASLKSKRSDDQEEEEAETTTKGLQIRGRSKFSTAMILIALGLSLFLAALDQTIVSVAVPRITSDLNSASGYTWIGGAYLLANAASGPVWGKISDIWGRKPILLTCCIGFFASSIICATATTIRTLIIGRAFQGTAGGGLIQLVMITISDLFSMKQRSLLFGMLEVIWALSGGAGPLLGGAFTEYVSWRWVFWINLPIGGVVIVLLFFYLKVHNPKTRLLDGLKAIDWAGSLSIIAVTLMILLGLDFGGQTFAWNSVEVICLLVFGCLTIGVFLFSERKLAKFPLMPLQLFTTKHNAATLLVTFVHGIVFMGAEYYLPLYTQSTKGATPLQAGLLMLPITLLEAATGIICGILMHRYGCYRELIWAGSLLMTLGAGLLILLDANSSIAEIVGLQVIVGAGLGFLFQPVVVAIQVLVEQKDIATATATSGFTRNIAASLGVVFGGVIFQNSMSSQAVNLRNAGLPSDVLDKLAGIDAAANVDIAQTLSDPSQRAVVAEAFAHSLQQMWVFYTCIAGVAVVASAFIKKVALSSTHEETKTGLLSEKPVESTELTEFSEQRTV